jgi:2,5-furandicarboxylate decarboxylase 1
VSHDLRTHLQALEGAGEQIVRVSREVSPDLELTSIVKLLERRGNPVVYFENVKGSKLPVVAGVNGTRNRIAIAIGTSPQRLIDHYKGLIETPIPIKEVATGPVKDVRVTGDDVDLRRLPLVTHAAHDSGPFLTSGVGLARDPESGAVNTGIYRMELKDRNHLTVDADAHGDLAEIIRRRAARGDAQDFVVAIGHHPALMIGSQADVPIDEDSLAVSGAILGEPMEMVPAETLDALVPAAAEIVLEGRFLGLDKERDGPFGEFAYYYSTDEAFLLEITAITHRSDAIFQDVHNVHPEHRNLWIVPNREAELLSTLRATFPNVHACHIVAASAGSHAYIQMTPKFEGEAKRVLMLALGSTVYLKQVIAVNADVDLWNPDELQWAIATRSQADRDSFTISHVSGYGADPSTYAYDTRVPRGGGSPEHDDHAMTTVVGIDATLPVQFSFAERADVLPTEFADLDLDDLIG